MQNKAVFTMPKNWVEASIKEVASVLPGYGFPEKYQGKSTGEIPFFKVRDISESLTKGSLFLKKANNYISNEECKELRAKPLNQGSIVFPKIGEALKLNRRAILAQPSLIDNNVVGITVFPEVLDHLYAYYFMLTYRLENLSRATTVPSVRKSDIEEIKIPLAPLNEQRRIAAKIEELFSFLDSGITYLRTVQVQLKRQRQSILKNAFSGRLTEEWRRNRGPIESAAELLRRISSQNISFENQKQTVQMPSLPESWVWTTMGQLLLDARYGTSQKCSYDRIGVPVLRIPNVTQGSLDFSDLKFTQLTNEEVDKLIVKMGDILVIRTNGSLDLVGRGAVANELPLKVVFASYLISLRPVLVETLPTYLALVLSSEIGRIAIESKARTTAGQFNVNLATLRGIPIPLSPVAEQKKIIETVQQSFSLIEHTEKMVQQNIARSKYLRSSTLKHAFEGKLVCQDPSEEPAEKLLQRTKIERLNNIK